MPNVDGAIETMREALSYGKMVLRPDGQAYPLRVERACFPLQKFLWGGEGSGTRGHGWHSFPRGVGDMSVGLQFHYIKTDGRLGRLASIDRKPKYNRLCGMLIEGTFLDPINSTHNILSCHVLIYLKPTNSITAGTS